MAKSHKKNKRFLNRPFYPGGKEAMSAFVKQHLQYPEEAAEAGIEGVVKVQIIIDHKGKVIEAQVLKKLGYGCDEEAVRVVKLLRFSVEKNLRMRVTFKKDLNVQFKREENPKTVQKINYIYREQQKPASKTSYSYRITRD